MKGVFDATVMPGEKNLQLRCKTYSSKEMKKLGWRYLSQYFFLYLF
jgi:hypothetical protein